LELPRPAALVIAAADPLALAERLQLPQRWRRLLTETLALRQQLMDAQLPTTAAPSQWAALLEGPGTSAAAVALLLAWGQGPRRPLLRWWLRWRHLGSEVSAAELIASGVPPGPGLGERLRQLRAERLDRQRI
jgi:poly(A) polymerase